MSDGMANLASIADGLPHEEALVCPDLMATGYSGTESSRFRISDAVAVPARGQVGLCATAGARLIGATTHLLKAASARRTLAHVMGADHIVDFTKTDPVAEIMRRRDGRGVDVAVKALGRLEIFEAALRVLRPGGTLSSLGPYSRSEDSSRCVSADLGDRKIIKTGQERMRRPMETIAGGRVYPRSLVSRRLNPERIAEACDLSANHLAGVLQVAITA